MDDRLLLTPAQQKVLADADELLDQLAEDAENLGQGQGARIARQGAEAIRKFTSRLEWDPNAFGRMQSGYWLRAARE